MSQITVQRVEPFFEHWLDFETTERGLTVPNGLGDDDGVALMPAMYRHPAVREFYRATELYRDYAPHWYWHLAAFYKAEWRIKQVKVGQVYDKRTRAMRPILKPRRERLVPHGVDRARVGTGVRFVVQVWDPDVDPSLPNQLLAA